MVIFQGFVKPTLLVSFGDAHLHPIVLNKLVDLGVPQASVCGYLLQGRDAPCTIANQQLNQVPISATTVLHGSRVGIPPIVANDYNIDLYNLQEMALA